MVHICQEHLVNYGFKSLVMKISCRIIYFTHVNGFFLAFNNNSHIIYVNNLRLKQHLKYGFIGQPKEVLIKDAPYPII